MNQVLDLSSNLEDPKIRVLLINPAGARPRSRSPKRAQTRSPGPKRAQTRSRSLQGIPLDVGRLTSAFGNLHALHVAVEAALKSGEGDETPMGIVLDEVRMVRVLNEVKKIMEDEDQPRCHFYFIVQQLYPLCKKKAEGSLRYMVNSTSKNYRINTLFEYMMRVLFEDIPNAWWPELPFYDNESNELLEQLWRSMGSTQLTTSNIP